MDATPAARKATAALHAADPVAHGVIGALAALTAADWRALDEATRRLADVFVDANLAGAFTARQTRTLLTQAAATRDAAR